MDKKKIEPDICFYINSVLDPNKRFSSIIDGLEYFQLIGEPASAPAGSAPAGSYPPNDISESLKSLPDWIKRGCGNEEYYCEEKNATFIGGKMPDQLPDLRPWF